MTSEPQDVRAPSFLPVQDAPSADEAFQALDADDPTLILTTQTPPPPIGRSWAFDFNRRRFLVVPGRGPAKTYGHETIRNWIAKLLNTARGAHPIYSDGYGITGLNDLIGRQLNSISSAVLQREVTDALKFHPRITDVQDWVSSFDDVHEVLELSFTVVLDDESLVSVTQRTGG